MPRAIIKQLLRRPKKYLLAAVLLGFSAFLLGTGLSLSLVAADTTAQINQSFQTVGTIEQIPDEYENYTWYSPQAKQEFTDQMPIFRRTVTAEALGALDGVLKPPLKQTTQLAHLFKGDGKKVYIQESDQKVKYKHFLFRFTADQDMTLGEAGSEIPSVKIDKILYGKPVDDFGEPLVGTDIELAYYGTELLTLKAGESYAACISVYGGMDGGIYGGLEALSDKEGNQLNQGGIFVNPDDALLQQIAEGFAFADDNSFAVLPVRSLQEYTAFLPTEFKVVDGREITPEEFEAGERVCLVPESVVRDPEDSEYPNAISIGDSITVEAYAKSDFGMVGNVIFTPGNQNETYKIVGAYAVDQQLPGLMAGMVPEQVLIPYTGDTALPNLGSVPYYRKGDASFVLENGKIPQFLAAAAKYDNLAFYFNDGGYVQAAAGIGAVSRIGIVMLLAGIVAFFAVGAFFVNLEISGGRRETGIRLALGEKKRRALGYLLVPLLFAVCIGTAAGVFAGTQVSGDLAQKTYTEATALNYDRSYSVNAVEELEEPFKPVFTQDALLYLGIWAGANLLCTVGALLYSRRVLKPEPHKLLGKGGTE